MRGMIAVLVLAGAVASGPVAALAADKAPKTRFWNLTGETVTKLELAPAGTQSWGPDQCKNDKDGDVDNDERLKLEGVAAGTYDARMTFKGGRVCHARGLKVEDGKVFSVEADQLKDCSAK